MFSDYKLDKIFEEYSYLSSEALIVKILESIKDYEDKENVKIFTYLVCLPFLFLKFKNNENI